MSSYVGFGADRLVASGERDLGGVFEMDRRLPRPSKACFLEKLRLKCARLNTATETRTLAKKIAAVESKKAMMTVIVQSVSVSRVASKEKCLKIAMLVGQEG